jgi:hypothetical protein
MLWDEVTLRIRYPAAFLLPRAMPVYPPTTYSSTQFVLPVVTSSLPVWVQTQNVPGVCYRYTRIFSIPGPNLCPRPHAKSLFLVSTYPFSQYQHNWNQFSTHLGLRGMLTGGVTCHSTKATIGISAMAGYGVKFWTQRGNYSSEALQSVVRSVHQTESFELVLPLLWIGALFALPC